MWGLQWCDVSMRSAAAVLCHLLMQRLTWELGFLFRWLQIKDPGEAKFKQHTEMSACKKKKKKIKIPYEKSLKSRVKMQIPDF